MVCDAAEEMGVLYLPVSRVRAMRDCRIHQGTENQQQRYGCDENTNGDENVQGICVYVLCVSAVDWAGDAFYREQFAAGERDTILTSVELPWSNPLGDGVAFPEYDGVYFVCDDGEILAGIWSTERYDLRQVQVTDRQDGLVEQEEPVLEYAGAGTKPQEEPVEEIPQIPLPSDMANGYEEMLTTYPKLPLFAGSQIVDGVKIAPQDIGKLDMANWKLGVNSFLAHGYYKYQYLMLGKVKMNKAELHVIGVPGIFTNKERYLANMFGFRVFIPVRKTKILTGNFGYWVSEIVESEKLRVPHQVNVVS